MRCLNFLRRTMLTLSVLLSAASAYAVPLTNGSGPGGVDRTNLASDLRVWLAAEDLSLTDGANITTWVNRTTYVGDGGDASVVNTAPTFENGVGDLKNGLPVLDFSGPTSTTVGDVLGSPVVANIVAADKTFFVVARAQVFTGGCCNGAITSNSNPNGISLQGTQWFTDFGGGGPAAGTPSVLGQWSFATGTYEASSPFNQLYTNGGAAFNNSGGLNRGFAGSQWYVGSRSTNGDGLGRFFDGQIAEVGIFNGAANFVERKLIENYLSSKYDIAMSLGDVYTGDTVGNGEYDYDVLGIGSDGTNSHLNSGFRGFGMEAGSLDASDWLLAGHDGTAHGIIEIDNADPNAQEPTTGERWERVYYLDKTGALDATLGFDFEDAGLTTPSGTNTYQLLYSADDDFSDGWDVLAATSLISSGTVTFNVLNANLLDGYYTLGINVQAVPEPGTWGLLGLGAIGLVWQARRRTSPAGRNAGGCRR